MNDYAPTAPYQAAPPPGQPPAPPRGEAKNDMLAWASLVFAFVFAPLGIIFGHAANHAAKRENRRRSVLAIVGLVISYVASALAIILIVGAAASSSTPTMTAAPASPAITQGPPAPTKAPTVVKPSSAPAPSPYGAKVGSVLHVTGDDGATWTVTVNSVTYHQAGADDEPLPAGQHYIQVNVTYRALTGKASPNEMDWESKQANGQTGNVHILVDSGTGELASNDIAAGQLATGNIWLAVPNGAHGTTIVYSSGLSEAGSWLVPASAS